MTTRRAVKTAVITGASSGIGAITAAQVRALGWKVAVVGRNRERTDAVAASIGATPFYADFDSLDEVRSLASALSAAYPRIDVLLNNAGGLASPRMLTVDGHERTIQRNHLAPFLLTALLRPRLEAARGRVVSTSSVASRAGQLRLDDLNWQERPWLGGWRAYGTSKLATVLFMRELARRSPLEAYSVHPGYVSTSFGADSRLIRIAARLREGGFGIPAEEGALPLIRLVTDPAVDAPNGSYFDRFTAGGRTGAQADDAVLAADLWERSAQLVGLPGS